MLTATPLPTATHVPTATPVPTVDSATLDPTARALAASTLLRGVQAAASAHTYRAVVAMRGNGSVGAVTLGQAHNPAEVMGMQANFSGSDYTFTLTGLITIIYGGNPTTGVRAARVAGQPYIHGPISLLAAFQDSWYRLPESRVAFASPPLYPAGLLALVAQSGIDPVGFTPVGTEHIDARSCRRFVSDQRAALMILKSLGESGLTVDTNPAHIDSVGASLWICDDGYLHQVEISFAGTTPGDPRQPFDFTLTLHMFDFGADMDVVAPGPVLDLMLTPTR